MIWGREPALIAGFVEAVVLLVLAFGVDITMQQFGAIMGVTIAGLAIVVRQKVTPNARVQALIEKARRGVDE